MSRSRGGRRCRVAGIRTSEAASPPAASRSKTGGSLGESRAHVHAMAEGKPRIRAIRQSRRSARRAGNMRQGRVPSFGSAQRFDQHDDDRRHALGRGALQQRRLSSQGHAIRRSYARDGAPQTRSNDSAAHPGRNAEEGRAAGNHAARTLGNFAARQRPARVRTRRRPERRGWRARARRRCGQARRQAQHARIWHAASHRSGISRPAENAPARSAAFAAGHERSARRLSRQRMHARATSCTRTTVRPSIPRSTLRLAIAASARRKIRRFRTKSPAIRSATNLRARSRRASAWSATFIRARTWWRLISATPGGTTNPTATRCTRSSSEIPARKKNSRSRSAIPKARPCAGCGRTRNSWRKRQRRVQSEIEDDAVRRFSQSRLALPRRVARDRQGHLLDENGAAVPPDDPKKFDKAAHLEDIHLQKGMQCVDCHFEQDSHGGGKLYAEPRAAIELDCVDCHGTISQRATLMTSGPAAPAGGTHLEALRTPWRERRFEWRDGKLYQRSMMDQHLEWEVVQTLDSITPGNPHYNEKSHVAKTLRTDGVTWGDVPKDESQLAHANSSMTCYACHTSWTPNCFGCHLSMTANQKRPDAAQRRAHHAQLDLVQLPGAARRRLHAGRGRHRHRPPHRAGALLVRGSGEFAERQSRVALQHAADGFRRGLQRPGVFHVRAAHRARARNEDVHRLPRLRRARQQRLDVHAASAGHELRQLHGPLRLRRHRQQGIRGRRDRRA